MGRAPTVASADAHCGQAAISACRVRSASTMQISYDGQARTQSSFHAGTIRYRFDRLSIWKLRVRIDTSTEVKAIHEKNACYLNRHPYIRRYRAMLTTNTHKTFCASPRMRSTGPS
jgi:hypothetical protein